MLANFSTDLVKLKIVRFMTKLKHKKNDAEGVEEAKLVQLCMLHQSGTSAKWITWEVNNIIISRLSSGHCPPMSRLICANKATT